MTSQKSTGFCLPQTIFYPNSVSSRPSLTYRRARFLCDTLVVSSHFGQEVSNILSPRGTFPYGNCPQCTHLDTRRSIRLPDGSLWKAKWDVTCDTQSIIYLMLCPCRSFYGGRPAGNLGKGFLNTFIVPR